MHVHIMYLHDSSLISRTIVSHVFHFLEVYFVVNLANLKDNDDADFIGILYSYGQYR